MQQKKLPVRSTVLFQFVITLKVVSYIFCPLCRGTCGLLLEYTTGKLLFCPDGIYWTVK